MSTHHRLRTLSVIMSLAVAGACLGPSERGVAQGAKEDRFITVSYPIGDLVSRSSGKTGSSGVGEVVRCVMTGVNPDGWHAKDGGSSLQVRNGSTLVIHTQAKYHQEISELLEALRRLNDVAVDVQSHLCEIDRSLYDKLIKPKLGNLQAGSGVPMAATLAEGAYQKLRPRLEIVTSHKVRIANGKQGEILSLENAVLTGPRSRADGKEPNKKPKPVDKKEGPDVQEQVQDLLNLLRSKVMFPTARSMEQVNDPAITFHGVRFQARVAVTADRRFVGMELEQEATNLLSLEQVPFGEDKVYVTPNLSRSGATASVRVGDGGVLFLAVYYLPQSLKDRNRVYVLVVQPRIYIEAEEKELQNAPPLP